MKYLMIVICGLMAAASGLAFTRHFVFVAPLTNWPLLLTVLASASLMMVRKPWKILAGGTLLIGASLLEFVGAFFTLITLIFQLIDAGPRPLNTLLDLIILVAIAIMSLLTSWLALGWGVWHTIRTPRQAFHLSVHA